MIEITIVCADEKLSSIKDKIEDLGIEVSSTDDESNTIKVSVSNEGYEALAEIPGITSLEKSSILDMWKQ